MRYLPLTETDRQAMLAQIGAGSIDDLFKDVPEEARRDELPDDRRADETRPPGYDYMSHGRAS